MKQITVAQKLCKLDSCIFSGNSNYAVSNLALKFIWNVYYSPQYSQKQFKLSKKEQSSLLKTTSSKTILRPIYFQIIEKHFGKEFLKREEKRLGFSSSEIFIINFTLYIVRNYLPQATFNRSLLNWFTEETILTKSKIKMPRLLANTFFKYRDAIELPSAGSKEKKYLLTFVHFFLWELRGEPKHFSEIFDQVIQIISSNFGFSVRMTIKKLVNEIQAYEQRNSKHAKPNYPKSYTLKSDMLFQWYIKSHSWLKHSRFYPKNLKTAANANKKPKTNSHFFYFNNKKLLISNTKTTNSKLRHFGVNLIGWPRTENGIGEDVRTAAACMFSSKIPFSIIDAAMKAPPGPRQVNTGFEKKILSKPRYMTDLVFLDAATSYRYYLSERFPNDILRRDIILVCPWELAKWPLELRFVFEKASELWAATKYIRRAFNPAVRNNTIRLMPPAVNVPRKHWRAPGVRSGAKTRFITIFDGLSSIHRKNPMAAVEAFKNAFPKDRFVELVIKSINVDVELPQYRQMLCESRNDKRIIVINKIITREKLWELVKSSDCFVSLHRAEGFGRNIAEAMLIGCPIVVSNYSGNTDFCNQENSWLVNGKLVPILPGEYSLYKNQSWFEPNIKEASQHMIDVVSSSKEARRRAELARQEIVNNYSIERVSKNYRQALEYFFKKTNDKTSKRNMCK